VFDKYSAQALQYSLSQGILPLREALAEYLSRRGRKVSPENLQITTGSQQGLDLIGRSFLEPGDYVLTEKPTYLGALQAFNFYQVQYCTVDMDEEGMLVDQLERNIKKYKPKLIYVVPNFQNPSGITMSLARRKELLRLAFAHHIPVVDDNPYGELRYSGEPQPSLCVLGGEAVLQLGTFSKLISPGLRVGWICAPAEALKIVEKAKQAADLHTTTFSQFLIYEFLRRGLLDDHVELIKASYSRRRDVMLETMTENFPDSVTWPHPDGGLFLWVQLPSGASATKIFDDAVEAGVAFVPGQPFHPDGSGDHTFRLNFANASEEKIVEGIKRLATVLKRHC
jgi:2-aminoadipate transaminase